MTVSLEDYEEMRDALREECRKLEAKNEWLIAYARELQERISTLVNLMIGLKERGELNSILPEHPMMLAALYEIERMRAALQAIANDPGGHPPEDVVDDMREIAHKALADSKE
jgi:hypothetical protein